MKTKLMPLIVMFLPFFSYAGGYNPAELQLDKNDFLQKIVKSEQFQKRIQLNGLTDAQVVDSDIQIQDSTWGIARFKIVVDSKQNDVNCELSGTSSYDPQTGAFKQVDNGVGTFCR